MPSGEWILFFVGLGFFLFVMHYIIRDEDKTYQRRLNEKREFGLQTPEPEPEPKPDRKSRRNK